MDIDFGGTVEGSDKVLTGFQMGEDTPEGLFQGIEVEVWVPNLDSLSERRRQAKQETLEMLRRAVATLEDDLGE